MLYPKKTSIITIEASYSCIYSPDRPFECLMWDLARTLYKTQSTNLIQDPINIGHHSHNIRRSEITITSLSKKH